MKSRANMQRRMFLLFFALSVAISIAALVPMSVYIGNILFAREEDTLVRLGAKTIEQIDASLTNMDKAALYFTSAISEASPSAFSKDGQRGRALDAVNINGLMVGFNVPRDNASWRVSVYTAGEYYTSSGTPDQSAVIETRLRSDAFSQWVADHVRVSGAIILPQHRDFWSVSGRMTVSVIRNAFNIATYAHLAFVEVQAPLSDFVKYLDYGQAGKIKCVLLSEAGEVLHISSAFELKNGLPLPESLLGASDGLHRLTLEGGRALVAVQRSKLSGWRLLLIVNEADTRGPLMLMLTTAAIVFGCVIGFALIMNYLISRRMARPIHALIRSISEVRPGNMSVEWIHPEDSDEIVKLHSAFNRMLSELETSTQQRVVSETRQLHAEINALQAQMNPHFLHNMLTVIDSYASERNIGAVGEICRRLSKMMRYLSNYGTLFVPLTTELDHVKNYLMLMKYRYEPQFSYTLSMDSGADLLKCRIPRHCVQPILENCFIHGFKKTNPPWLIAIRVCVQDGRWTVGIQDNGAGFLPEELDALHAKIQETDRQSSEAAYSSQIGGLGLLNTCLRLKLLYPKDAVFQIENRNGCCIRLGGIVDDPRDDR